MGVLSFPAGVHTTPACHFFFFFFFFFFSQLQTASCCGVAGACQAESLPVPWNECAPAASCWALREGAASGQGRPGTSTDPWAGFAKIVTEHKFMRLTHGEAKRIKLQGLEQRKVYRRAKQGQWWLVLKTPKLPAFPVYNPVFVLTGALTQAIS